MLFKRYKQTIKVKDKVKIHFVESNSNLYTISVLSKSGSDYEFLKTLDLKDRNFSSGTAHYLEHMMFYSRKFGGHLTKVFRENGIEHNAMTSPKFINFFTTSRRSNFLDIALESTLRSVLELDIDQSTFDRERKIIKNEIISVGEDDLTLSIRREYLNGFSSSQNNIGTLDSIDNIIENDIIEYFKLNVIPENIDVFIAGKFDDKFIDQIMQKIHIIFNDIKVNSKINCFQNELSYELNLKNINNFDQKEFIVKHNKSYRQRLLAINRLQLDLNLVEWKQFKEFLTHFTRLIDTSQKWKLNLKDKYNFMFDVQISTDHFINTDNTFYIELNTPELNSQEINELYVCFKETIMELLSDYENNFVIYNKNKVKTSFSPKEALTYHIVVNNYDIYGFDEENEIDNKMFTKKLEKIDFENYVDILFQQNI